MPPRIGQLLGVVRKLMDYGRQLAARLQQHVAAPTSGRLATAFGTTNTGLIIARIIHGLHLAAALESRLARRAAEGRDLGAEPAHASSPRRPRPARSAAVPPDTQLDQDPGVAHLPTPQEIAEQIRHRPIGAVIAEICLDFGIVPGHADPALWDELVLAIVENGGSLARYLNDLFRQVRLATDRPAIPQPAHPSPMPRPAAFAHAAPTGPP